MCKTALIIQHVLPKFQQSNDGIPYFDPAEYLSAIIRWIDDFRPKRIIVTKGCPDDVLYPELEEVATHVEEWKWHHELDGATESMVSVALGVPEEDVVYTCSKGSDFFSIKYQWMKDLAGYRVTVMGGLEDECLRGLLDGLEKLDCDDGLDINYKVHSDRVYPR